MRGKAKMLLLPFNLVCLALILASFFDKNVAYNEDRVMATIQQNLIYALFPGDGFPQTRYKFDGTKGLEDWRLEQLNNISEIDNTGMPRGSTQSNDVLTYDEWNAGVSNQVFHDAVTSLLNKVEIFTSNNDNIYSCNANDVENDLKKYDRIQNTTKKLLREGREEREVIHSRRKRWLSKICQCFTPSTSSHHSFQHETSTQETIDHCEELIELIIRCKVFIRDLHSEGGEGSLIDIFSFMEKHEELGHLIQILNLSKFQSRGLDKAINERIYQEHLENKMRKEYKNAIVQGAGPVGLYATYKLFIEGVNVTLVNDRSEDYTRNRVVFFDRKWMSQLRFFLGTEFDKLFIDKQNGEKSLGRILDEDIGFVNIKHMETFLKDRLKVLSSYINGRERQQGNQQEKAFLNLIYNTAVLTINTDYEKPLAILGAPVKRPESFDFNHVRVMLMNYEGMVESDEIIGIPFDLFFCAGGARDHIRTQFIEPPQQLTESVNYGVVIFDKMNPSIKVFEDSAAFYRDPMAGMTEHLVKQNIDGLILHSSLSEELKSKFANLTEMILRDKQIVVRLFESNPTLHIASITPRALVNFIEELQNEKGNNANLKEYYDNFHAELQKRWAKALFSYTFSTRHPNRLGEVVIEGHEDEHVGSSSRGSRSKGKAREPEQVLYFDPHSANTSTFWVAIYGVENPVKQIEGSSAIIAAIGDANTSAHFMTASGISTGKFQRKISRLGVENAVNAIKAYNQSNEELNLEALLRAALKKVRRRVLEKAQEYVKIEAGVRMDLEN
uniref:Uncharacterized protein n=1 Tax=Meloidogyne javanica TaxID=6303 RepID=A0A915LCQ9_MELJA